MISRLACAEAFADADLAGAFGDADQHDVHDHDAADDQRNAGDGNDDGGDEPRMESTKERTESGVRVSKLSSCPGRAWKWLRSATRVRSRRVVHGEPGAGARLAEHGRCRAGRRTTRRRR